MAAGWIIKRNNKENGPFSPQQLKQFAASGKLKPEDLIRKEPGGKFARADSVKGLFPEESLEEADAGDSADLANIDISRYGELPMEDEDEDDDEEDSGPRKKSRSKTGTKTPARSEGKGKKSSKKGKSKAKKEEFLWENDPVDDLAYGVLLVGFAVGVLFFMDPEKWELPQLMVTIHQYTGRFGVSVFLVLVSLIFWVIAFQKIGRLNSKGYSIPWHFPNFYINLNSLFGGSEEDSEE